MASANEVLAARSALAHAVRNSGDPDEIAIARDNLAMAKAARLRADAEALLQGRTRDETRIIGYADEAAIPRELHEALLARQREEVAEFMAANPTPREWSNGQRDQYAALLAHQKKAHRSLGCSALSACVK